MIGFYDLAPEAQGERVALLARAVLGSWGLEARAIDLIKYRENAVFRVAASDGQQYALRVHRAGYHTDLARHLDGIDGVYCVGPLMRHLHEVLPGGKSLGWHDDPATLRPGEVAGLLKAGDVVVVKGSKKMFWVNKFVPGLVAALQAKA